MQIGRFGYPHQVLTGPQITICLEAYIMWLFSKVMFTDNHVDTISAGFITIAQEISVAQNQAGIVPRSFGSAVLAGTYRAMCSVCTKNKESSSIHVQPSSVTDMYPLEAIAGTRNYAVSTILLFL